MGTGRTCRTCFTGVVCLLLDPVSRRVPADKVAQRAARIGRLGGVGTWGRLLQQGPANGSILCYALTVNNSNRTNQAEIAEEINTEELYTEHGLINSD